MAARPEGILLIHSPYPPVRDQQFGVPIDLVTFREPVELAYIDPGSGSLIIQAIIATIVAVPIVFQSTFRRILHGLRSRGQRNDQ